MVDLKLRWLIAAAILVTFFEILSLGQIRMPVLLAIPLYLTMIFIIGSKTIWNGILALLHFDFTKIQLLMTIAVAGAFYLGEYEEASVVIVLFTLAEKLESYGITKSKKALSYLVEKVPKVCFLKGNDQPVPTNKVKAGQKILVKPFQVIPLDGQVVQGSSFVDESSITGEPIAQDKRAGDTVFAGTENKAGSLELIVMKESGDTVIAGIQKAVKQAFGKKAKAQQYIEKLSFYYTPSILFLALFWISSSWYFYDRLFLTGFSEGLNLLVIACPCALVISTPISVYSAIGNASGRGVLIKGGSHLESLAKVKAMAFDKTRTLTKGEPVVSDLIPFHGHSIEDLLACAAGIEIFSEHPLAQSIVNEAMNRGISPHEVKEFQSFVGKGARAECLVCDEAFHSIGKLKFVLEQHEVKSSVLEQVELLQNQGKTAVVVCSKKEVEGIIGIEDAIRQESVKVVSDLKKLGIVPLILTGDHEVTARAVGNSIGITIVKADLLPEDKEKEIKELKKHYQTVSMVGDGVNDAPALTESDVGISISTPASDLSNEVAGIVLYQADLRLIPYLVCLSKKMVNLIRFNTSIAISVKFIFISLALIGSSNLTMAIFADVGVTLLVVLNSLRLMTWEPKI